MATFTAPGQSRQISASTYAALLRRLPPPDERRSIREAAGVSQSQVARELDVSVTAVGLWERGTRGFSPRTIGPYVELLEALAKIAGGEGVAEGGPK